MSTLWKITVMEKKDDYIDLLVKFSHPDAGPFPQDKNFALQLLINEAYGFDENFNRYPNSPLGKAISPDKFQPDDLDDLVDSYIKDTIIYEAQNLPWDESEAHEQMDELCHKDGLEDEDDDWDEAWNEHWIEFWKDYNRIPWAIYRITTTDPQWTDHLEKYQEFDSAAYSNSYNSVDRNTKVDVTNPSQISDYISSEKQESSEALDFLEGIADKQPILKKLFGNFFKNN
ncbi:hypothetical protein [Chryseobacterium sp. 5_R23647]|uniref:hypothetical protein n=1 Tax=Chryseobacterium sp. 5_R23647 TaxID=2258964 RepID=UPI000E22A8C7|nr:hypothetical protein [Chryseobacterium sp. 5_R23647]REC41412.1 hypothetical protein DRF69_15385 [Chryseobacterium sp. 5_R23647]